MEREEMNRATAEHILTIWKAENLDRKVLHDERLKKAFEELDNAILEAFTDDRE
jgi:hypothetical protein